MHGLSKWLLKNFTAEARPRINPLWNIRKSLNIIIHFLTYQIIHRVPSVPSLEEGVIKSVKALTTVYTKTQVDKVICGM